MASTIVDTFVDAPLIVTVPIPAVLTLAAAYRLLSPRWDDERSRAYVLSTFSSAGMSLVSLPYVYAYAMGGMPALWALGQAGWTKTLADATVACFGAYLFADLAVGWLCYRKEIGFLTGWIHHTVYIGVMVYLSTTKQASVFAAAAFMEVPTFDLAISHLYPSLRSDERFLSLMVLLRILYNMVLIIDCVRNRTTMDGSWVPTTILTLGLCMHVSWTQAGIKGYFRRRAKARRAANVAAIRASALEVPLAPTPKMEAMTPDLGPVSDDDEPIHTPHTPSQPAVTIRDNFFPTIGMPTMANLPIPAIPNLKTAIPQAKAHLRDFNSGFAEAVRDRWEERRERFRGLRRRHEPIEELVL